MHLALGAIHGGWPLLAGGCPRLEVDSEYYSLAPIGIGTPMAECLPSYITRLAHAVWDQDSGGQGRSGFRSTKDIVCMGNIFSQEWTMMIENMLGNTQATCWVRVHFLSI